MKVQITNTKLIRDIDNQAVLNTDAEGLREYNNSRLRRKKELIYKEKLEDRISNLEEQIKFLMEKVK